MGKGTDRFANALIALMVVGLLASAVLTVMSAFVRGGRASENELARLGLEDVARRVERGVRNLRSVREMSDAVALSRARSLAQLVAENPSVLKPENRAKFDAYAELLEVDELHVTDEKGILVRCRPSVYEGHDMSASAQSSAFLPAITNAAFALVQEPQLRGLSTGDSGRDKLVFQYAGVARRDAPGIVQIGYRAERVAEAMRLADIDSIAASTRIGRNGRVRIVPQDSQWRTGIGYREVSDGKGCRTAVFESDCEGYRISVLIPLRGSFLADERAFSSLLVLDLILILALAVAFPTARVRIVRDVRSFCAMVSERGAKHTSILKTFISPLSLAVAAFFAILLFAIYTVTVRSSLKVSRDRLRAAAEDIVEELDGCVDAQLSFIGRELGQFYGSPEAMKDLDLRRMLKTYFVDEINVVNGDGFVLASTVPAILGKDEWKSPNPARFCQALIKDGKEVFEQPFRQSATESTVFRKYVGVAFPPPAKGFIQLGFDRSRLHNSIDYHLRDLVHNWHVGETGFYVIAKTSNGEILSTRDGEHDGETLASMGFDVFSARMNDNTDERDPVSCDFRRFSAINFFESKFAGKRCLCTGGIVNQFHRYIVALPISEVYGPAWRILSVASLAFLIAFVAVVLFVTKLSNLVVSLKGYITREKESREKDLAVAKTIQLSSLPPSFPDLPEWRIFAQMDTAREVGGDFFDFNVMPDGRVFFLVADVSGKGIPAAMFMMKAKATIRACIFEKKTLADAVTAANDRLAENNDANMFVTAWFGLFDVKTGALEYVNAGHNLPLVKRANGSVEWIRDRNGLVLAAMGDMPYSVGVMMLQRGDSIFLYTDGVTEAMNEQDELYGEERLEKALKASSEYFITDIRRDVSAFVGGAEQSDDITMLALDYKRL